MKAEILKEDGTVRYASSTFDNSFYLNALKCMATDKKPYSYLAKMQYPIHVSPFLWIYYSINGDFYFLLVIHYK